MAAIIPPPNPADLHSVFALLSAIADPVASKKRLEELVEGTQETAVLAAKADAAAKEAATAKAAAERLLLDNQQVLAKIEQQNTQRAAELTNGLNDLGVQRNAFNENRAALDKAISETRLAHRNKEIELSSREQAVTVAERKLEAEQAKVSKLRADYEAKLSRLKAVVE